ncbi:unnamed protein product [Alopecurus aequalis]
MVSWGDGEESSEDHSSHGVDLLTTMYDSDFCGLAEEEGSVRCKHHSIASKYVCFEGWNTGRRFLGCEGQDGEQCDFVHWVDPEWPRPLQKALAKLWEDYGEAKQGRVSDALDNLEKKFKYQDEIKLLHRDLKIMQDEVDKVIEEKKVTLALKAQAEQALLLARAELEQKKRLDASTSNMHKVLRIQAEKDRDKFKGEKIKLEFIIADLLKQKEGTRAKMMKIKEICDE